MTRVWLSAMEWACCGDPFAVGDEVNFVIGRRSPSEGFVRDLGAELSATVDAFEARHPERPVDDRVRGRVVAVQIVLQETVHRFTLRRPGYGAPPDAEMPDEGELWPLAGRDLGNGLFAGTRPTRWMRESEPLPGSVELVPSDAVPGDVADSADSVSETDLDGPQPSSQRARVRRGWLVDVEEGDV